MPPKNKGTKLALNDFLNDESTGKLNWADDVGDLSLAPLPSRNDHGPSRGSDWLSSQPDRGDRDRSFLDNSDRGFDRGPPRQELPLPTAPPFTAFVGNLSFDVQEPEIEDFFAPSKCTSVRLLKDADGRPKGFGYVEFETLDGLKDALTKSGAQLVNRTVRVGVAEPRDARAGGSSVAEEASQWRRAGPLPPSDGGMGARRSERPGFGRPESGPSGFDAMENRSGFGTRFTPAAPREFQQTPARRPMAEPLEPSQGDTASDWRTGKPTTEAPGLRRTSGSPATMGAGPDGVRGAMRSGSRGDATEIDERFTSQDRLGFGSKFVPTPPESPSMAKRPGFGFDRRVSNAPGGPGAAPGAPPAVSDEADTWRSSRKASNSAGSNAAPPAVAGEASGSPAPAQRKKLELKPRSVPAEGSADAGAAALSPTTASSNKPNPFGMAKPVDASERERAIEAKLAAQEEKRKEEEKKRKEKVRAEREKAQSQTPPTGAKADRNRSKGPTSEKGSETSSSAQTGEGAAAASDAAGVASPTSTAPTGPKQAPKTGAWGGGRKPSGALLSGQQSPAGKGAAINGSSTDGDVVDAAETNGSKEGGVEAAEVQKAVESLKVAES